MAYTAGTDTAEATTAETDDTDEQAAEKADRSVGAAYTAGDSKADLDADTDSQEPKPDSETAQTVRSHYLAVDSATADDGSGSTPEEGLTDAESDDIELGSDGDSSDPDSTASDS